MRKRLTIGLAAGLLAATMLPGVTSAAPNPDSAAGRCGALPFQEGPGIGDSIQASQDLAKLISELGDIPLGRVKQALAEPAYDLPDTCAPGHQP